MYNTFPYSIQLDPVTQEDMRAALATTKPSARTLKERYLQWQAEFESV